MVRASCTLLFVLVFSAARAQSPPVKLDIDFATFAYDDENSLLELYLAVGSNTLEYHEDSTGLFAYLPLYLTLSHATVATLLETPPDPVWADSMLLQFQLEDSSFAKAGQHFVHQIRALAPPGEYTLAIAIPPTKSRPQEQSVNRDIQIPDYSDPGQTTVSDIMLATSISRSQDQNDQFYKNGLSIRPNPQILFGSNLPRLYYYLEAYNPGGEGDTTYTVYSFVSRSTLPQPVNDLESRTTRHVRSPDAVLGSYDVSQLPTGSYLLNVVLLDRENRSLVEQNRKFFVYNPDVQTQKATAAVDVAYETSYYASMSNDELDEQIRYALIIATDREEDALKSARNEDAKREALMEFWAKRDPDPTTPINEVREEYYTRIQYTRERYSNAHSEGWQTDRGRIYLKYGTPAHVNPHHYDRDMAPYEIWEYDNIPGQGNAMFVFADVSGFNEFELIHSNVAGERQSLDWQAELRDK